MILWAIWYLLALGYGFRYLQYSQHRIEDDLGWERYRSEGTGKPPAKVEGLGNLFWVLPGIYHAHLAGLIAVIVILIGLAGVFVFQESNLWSALFTVLTVLAIAIAFTWWAGFHYLGKIRGVHASRDKCESPDNCERER